MSDVRALLARRGIEVGDGAYFERAGQVVHPAEEWLRDLLARFAFGSAKPTGRFVRRVSALEGAMQSLDEAGLRSTLWNAARRMHRVGFEDALIAQAFAVVREASLRTLGKRHYDVQLLAGRGLLRGKIVEMATGEGKTLAATLGVCTAAAAGAAVHVVTVNDYLAERDADDNAALYKFLGLTVGVVKQDMSIEDRRFQYAKDIVYVSNKELTFDYLKDRIALRGKLASQIKLDRLRRSSSAQTSMLRGLHVAIVDEADSVLIDEARTPLIISETLPDDLGEAVYHQAIDLANSLQPLLHYAMGKNRDVWLTTAGEAEVARRAVELETVWASSLWQKDLVTKALSAVHLFHKDQHYIVVENSVQIVDEFTGRVMPDRTWERGLHQMIEAKEGCEISGQRRTLSQITYQRFFGRYLLLAGMTGTAKEVGPELKRVYDLTGVRVPTHKPSRRERLPNRVFRTSAERWRAVADRATEIAAHGRAVLIGTRSVEASEELSHLLTAQGILHTVLNARQDHDEAEAVAAAGQAGRITVATNMAGRGTDIKLATEVEQRGGLHVILTEFHESARVDRQLFGRSARQGNPGTVEAMVSLQDELFQRYLPGYIRRYLQWLRGTSGLQAIFFARLVNYAQWRAEIHNRRIRLDTIRRDRKWLDALGFVGAERK